MTGPHDHRPGGADGDHLGDDVVDLALGHVTGARRSTMAVHLLACRACRADYDETVAAVDEAVLVAPSVQPPLGFDERTLARMGVGGAALVQPPAPSVAARPRWRPLAAVAAVLVVVALAVGAWVGLGDASSSDTEQVAALVASSDGSSVGTATRAEVDGEPVLVVGLVAAEDGASYTCRMRFADGSTLDTDPWAAAPGAAWLVPLPADRGALEDIALVGVDSGSTWSTAEF